MLTIYTNSIRNSVPLTSCRPRRTPVLGPSHTQTQRHGVLAMMIRPYKPRDSARSALLTAVRNRRSGPWRLAVHPRRVLHGPAAPNWRGEIRVGRTSSLKQRSRVAFDSASSPCQSPWEPRDPRMGWRFAPSRTYTGPLLADARSASPPPVVVATPLPLASPSPVVV